MLEIANTGAQLSKNASQPQLGASQRRDLKRKMSRNSNRHSSIHVQRGKNMDKTLINTSAASLQQGRSTVKTPTQSSFLIFLSRSAPKKKTNASVTLRDRLK